MNADSASASAPVSPLIAHLADREALTDIDIAEIEALL